MSTIRRALAHLILMGYVLFSLLPILWVALSSFKTDREIVAGPWNLPHVWAFQNYIAAWSTAKINIYFFNSAFVSLTAGLVTLLLSAGLAFGIARMYFSRISRVVQLLLLLGLLVPPGSLLIPIYFTLLKLNFYNTYLALILPYITFALPLSSVILIAFMRKLPKELEEAAFVDGIGALGIFWRIALPLTVPALSTVFILAVLGNWNEFVMANFYLSSDKLKTIPVGMVAFKSKFSLNYSGLSAGIMISILPIIILYAFLQKQIIEGLTAGSVKG